MEAEKTGEKWAYSRKVKKIELSEFEDGFNMYMKEKKVTKMTPMLLTCTIQWILVPLSKVRVTTE